MKKKLTPFQKRKLEIKIKEQFEKEKKEKIKKQREKKEKFLKKSEKIVSGIKFSFPKTTKIPISKIKEMLKKRRGATLRRIEMLKKRRGATLRRIEMRRNK